MESSGGKSPGAASLRENGERTALWRGERERERGCGRPARFFLSLMVRMWRGKMGKKGDLESESMRSSM